MGGEARIAERASVAAASSLGLWTRHPHSSHFMPKRRVGNKKAKRWTDKAPRWQAKFDGKCAKCKGAIKAGDLVARETECPLKTRLVHNQCHSDWLPPTYPKGHPLAP